MKNTICKLFIFVIIFISLRINAQTAYDTISYYEPMSRGIIYLINTSSAYTVGSGEALGAGDGWSWIDFQYISNRSFLTFDITPWLSLTDRIISIRLLIYLAETVGNGQIGVLPIWNCPGGDTTDLVLDHVNYGDYVDVGDWTAGDPGDPQTIESNAVVVTTNPNIGWKSPAVTNQVVYDLVNQTPYSQYRLCYHITTDKDGLDDFVHFWGHSGGWDVYLIAEYSTLGIIQDKALNLDITISPNPFVFSTDIIIPNTQLNLQGIEIYNLLGKCVRTFSTENVEYYNIKWNGKSDNEGYLPSGVYIFSITTQSKRLNRKITFLK